MGRHKIKVVDTKTATAELVERATSLFGNPYDDREGRDPSLPTLRSVADQLHTTILRTRKLLITGSYFSTAISREVQSRVAAGESVEQIMAELNLSRASVYSYLPYKDIAFNLPVTTSNADRHRLYRKRKKAVRALQEEKNSINLWEAIVVFQNYKFKTSGRGKTEGVEFTYTVSKGGPSGRQYTGESVDGWGNELFVGGHEKSITRSSVDYALNLALTTTIKGPKSLKIFGSSYVYAIFHRFGLV